MVFFFFFFFLVKYNVLVIDVIKGNVWNGIGGFFFSSCFFLQMYIHGVFTVLPRRAKIS